MKKKLWLSLIVCSSLYSLELDIGKNENNISFDKIESYNKHLVPSFLVVDNKEIIKNLNQNSLFAKEYLKNKNFNKDELLVIVEDFLAKQYKKELLNNYDISDDVLESYYILNKDKYVIEESYDIKIFFFSKKEKATKGNLNEYDYMLTYDRISISNLPNLVKLNVKFLKEDEYSNTIFDGENYIIFYFTKKYLPQQLSFEDVKKELREELLKKKFFEILDKEYERLKIENEK